MWVSYFYVRILIFAKIVNFVIMKKSPLVKYIIWSTVVVVAFVCFIRRDNIWRWIGAGMEIRRQEQKIDWYNKEISSLESQIDAMTSDPDTLEKYGREHFLFAEPGDEVFLIDEKKK